ncbi:MAG TPA: hypothetical protein DIW52_26915 [Pseudomonas sp.]|nr:hypothetical protein [Pseudomonas sp.]
MPAKNDNAVYLIHRGVPFAGKPRSYSTESAAHHVNVPPQNKPRRNPGFVVSGYPVIIRRILWGI